MKVVCCAAAHVCVVGAAKITDAVVTTTIGTKSELDTADVKQDAKLSAEAPTAEAKKLPSVVAGASSAGGGDKKQSPVVESLPKPAIVRELLALRSHCLAGGGNRGAQDLGGSAQRAFVFVRCCACASFSSFCFCCSCSC